MKIQYFPKTDTLSIRLNNMPSAPFYIWLFRATQKLKGRRRILLSDGYLQ